VRHDAAKSWRLPCCGTQECTTARSGAGASGQRSKASGGNKVLGPLVANPLSPTMVQVGGFGFSYLEPSEHSARFLGGSISFPFHASSLLYLDLFALCPRHSYPSARFFLSSPYRKRLELLSSHAGSWTSSAPTSACHYSYPCLPTPLDINLCTIRSHCSTPGELHFPSPHLCGIDPPTSHSHILPNRHHGCRDLHGAARGRHPPLWGHVREPQHHIQTLRAP
jgi:hypothetical protein